jgi:hypothetical protein
MNERHTPMVDAARHAAQLRQEAAAPAADDAGEGAELEREADYPAYSILSADRQRKVMVEFRRKNGNAKALAYSYLVALDFDPSEGIAMDFSGYTVKIAGRNLRPLFEGVVAQRVAVVREMDELQAEANLPQDATVVTKIEIKPVD